MSEVCWQHLIAGEDDEAVGGDDDVCRGLETVERGTGGVVEPGGFREGGDDDDVLACALEPAVKGDHAVLVVNVEGIGVFSPQSE